jgi:hypothetical protein
VKKKKSIYKIYEEKSETALKNIFGPYGLSTCWYL